MQEHARKIHDLDIVGRPDQLHLQRAVRGGASVPGGLDPFVDKVVPLLRERGVFRTEYEGTTLRENLGLGPLITAEAVSAAR